LPTSPRHSSILADRIASAGREKGYVITESGFGADCGMEKFMTSSAASVA